MRHYEIVFIVHPDSHFTVREFKISTRGWNVGLVSVQVISGFLLEVGSVSSMKGGYREGSLRDGCGGYFSRRKKGPTRRYAI